MSRKQELSPAVVYTATFQVLWGLIWVFQAFESSLFLIQLLILSLSVGHFYAAYGLFRGFEWGRQRAVQLCGFDVLNAVYRLLTGHLSPLGALLTLGMPLYTLSVLNDEEVRERFS